MRWPWRKKRAKESFASKREREIRRLEGIARQLEVSFGFRPGERQRLIAELAEAKAGLEEAKWHQRAQAQAIEEMSKRACPHCGEELGELPQWLEDESDPDYDAVVAAFAEEDRKKKGNP